MLLILRIEIHVLIFYSLQKKENNENHFVFFTCWFSQQTLSRLMLGIPP